jgi:ketose-bisphosphate aldolase
MNKKYKFSEVLADAYKNHYAIPAFDWFDLSDARAMLEVAEEMKTPMIMMTLGGMAGNANMKLFVNMIETLSEKMTVPIFTHVDHSNSVDQCLQAIDVGFDSVMIDASADPLDENIRKTSIVAEYGKKHGVVVEAEMGRIKSGKITVEGGYNDRESFLVQTPDAIKLFNATKVDMLAVGIGNQHGFYVEKPQIHFDRLIEVNTALGIPLVMHGGSGLPQDMVRESIRNGITKVNVATDIATAFSDALRADMNTHGEHAMYFRAIKAASEAAKKEIRRWVDTCMSAGKA